MSNRDLRAAFIPKEPKQHQESYRLDVTQHGKADAFGDTLDGKEVGSLARAEWLCFYHGADKISKMPDRNLWCASDQNGKTLCYIVQLDN